MRARTCVSVVVCVARKLRPCPSYSGRRDRNNSVHWRTLYKGGGGVASTKILAESEAPPRRCGLTPFRACLLLARLLLATCLLAACLLAKPVTSTLDTKEGYKNKTVSTSLVSRPYLGLRGSRCDFERT